MTLTDVGWVVGLPLLTALANTLPERRWPQLARVIARFDQLGSDPRDDHQAMRSLELAGLGRPGDALRLRAARAERLLHTLRELVRGWNPDLVLAGREQLDAAHLAGRGAVLWIARCSYAALVEKMTFAKSGYAVHHVSRPQHGFSGSRFGMRFLNPLRTTAEYRYAAGRILIAAENPAASMAAALKILRQNAFVSILGGVTEGQLLVRVRLGASELEFSSGPPRLAKLAGAPLLPVFVHRDEATGAFHTTVEPPIDLSGDGGKDGMIERAAQAFADRHLRFIAEHPLQWRDWHKLAAPRHSAELA